MKAIKTMVLAASLLAACTSYAAEYVTRGIAGDSSIQFVGAKGKVLGEYSDFVGGILYTEDQSVDALHIVMKTEGFTSTSGVELSDQFPKAAFSTGSVAKGLDGVTLKGNLTLQGKASPVSMKVESIETQGAETIKAVFSTAIDPAKHDLDKAVTKIRFNLVGALRNTKE